MSDRERGAKHGLTSRTTEIARAKVNLGLAITGRRPDGYHELCSVFLRIGLADRLSGWVDETLDADRLSIDGGEDCPVDGNTVLGAVMLLRGVNFPLRELRAPLPALAFRLQKRIPIAAGLGGGSTDGAAAISLAMALWSVSLGDAERVALAAQLGADVPFFVAGHEAALVSGIGDQMKALPGVRGEAWLMLVTPAERLSTAEVFAEFDRLPARPSAAPAVDALATAFRDGIDGTALAGWGGRLRDANDLWPAAVSLRPSLERLRADLEHLLDRPFLLTGSGSTLFALYASRTEAEDAGARLAATPSVFDGVRAHVAGVDPHQEAGRIQ